MILYYAFVHDNVIVFPYYVDFKKNTIVQTKKLKMFVSVKPQYEMKVGYILAATEECFDYTTLIRIKEGEKRKKTKQSAQQMEKHIT